MQPDPQRVRNGRKGAYKKWGRCDDRTAATAPGRAKFERRFLDQADGDPVRAANLRKLYFMELADASARARARRKAAGA